MNKFTRESSPKNDTKIKNIARYIMKKTISNIILIGIILITCPKVNAQVCYDTKTSYIGGLDAVSICSADFNGDSKPDIAVINNASGTSNISVLLNNGSGGFGAPTFFAVGALPHSICTADFNGDGIADLATTNIGPGNVSVLLGNGSGGFTAAAGFGTGIFNSLSTICSADFNGDGKVDLVISSGFNFVLVALGNGNGTFGTPTQITVDNNTHSVISADFNGDGKADMATTTHNGTFNVSVQLGNGSGGFGTVTNFVIGDSPASLICADLNGDGKIDLATANMGNNITGNVSILLGDGTGSFAAATNFGVGVATVAKSICSGDFDRDGKMDLAMACIANNNNGIVTILTGNGAGSFGSPATFAVDSFPNSIVSADFNKDTKMDLAVATNKSNIDTGKVAVLLNCNTTGMNQFAIRNRQAILYPNPGHGIFYVNAESGISQIEITNMLGEIIYTSQIIITAIDIEKAAIDLSKQAKGIYCYRLQSGGEISGTGKIIIE
jgi:hypothetical protein